MNLLRRAASHSKALNDQAGRRLWRYATPSIVGMLIVGVQMFVDGIFVAQGVGAIGLAAVNLSMPLISVMLSVAIMIVSGGIVVCGVAKGEGDDVLVKGYTSLTFLVLVITSALMALLVGLNLHKLCYLLGADDAVYPHMRKYLGIIGCGFFFYCVPNITEAFNRLAGKPNWVFASGVICCVVNVVLDYIFVLRMGLGTAGAAVATCIANSSAALVLLPNVRFGRLKGSLQVVWRMFYNGSSEMFTSVSAAVAGYIFNIVLMSEVGHTGVAALTIVSYLNLMVNMSIYGLSGAMYPLMSYELGARNYRGLRSLLRNALFMGGCIGVGVFLLVLVFKPWIISAFASDDNMLAELTRTAASVVTLHYLVSFINIVASSFHTAVERPFESVLIAVCRSIVFILLPLCLLTPRIGVMGVWLSMPIAEALTLLLSIPLMRKTMRKIRKEMVAR